MAYGNQPAGTGRSGAGNTGTGAGAGSNRSTGASSRFDWGQMDGRAPSSARLSWIDRQFSEQANVARARRTFRLGRDQANEDLRLAKARRGTEWVDQRLDAGQAAAAGGGARNPALVGRRMADLAGAYTDDVHGMEWEAAKTRQQLRSALEQAIYERLMAKQQMGIEGTEMASADRLVEGL